MRLEGLTGFPYDIPRYTAPSVSKDMVFDPRAKVLPPPPEPDYSVEGPPPNSDEMWEHAKKQHQRRLGQGISPSMNANDLARAPSERLVVLDKDAPTEKIPENETGPEAVERVLRARERQKAAPVPDEAIALPFTFRPAPVRSGRVIFKEERPAIKKEFGFDDGVVLDLSHVTIGEAHYVKRQIKAWVKETKYRAGYTEIRPFLINIQHSLVGGIFGGGIAWYLGVLFPRHFRSPKRYMNIASVIGGAAGGVKLALILSSGSVWSEVLRRNTAFSYKGRQFLAEYRKRREEGGRFNAMRMEKQILEKLDGLVTPEEYRMMTK